MRKLSSILALFVLFLFAVFAYPQNIVVPSMQSGIAAEKGSGVGQGSGSSSSDGKGGIVVSSGAVGGIIGSFSGAGLRGVRGQPFSADVIEEMDQNLADGNHIHRETHGRVFRDSEGRSRNENEIGAFFPGSKPFVHIQISDPVQNLFIMLDPEHKMATIHHFGEGSGGVIGAIAPAQRPSGPAQPAKDSPQPGVHAVLDGQGAAQTRDMRAQLSEMQRTREDLGTMEIEGFTVKGTRLTHIIPAGAMGNDKPMTSTSEHWFSDELKMDLLDKSVNPQSGQHVRKLVNIRSGEPDPLLFQVPPDYTVKESDAR